MSKNHPFQGGKWFQKQIDQRVRASLVLQEEQFAREHNADSDAQLLDYVCACAQNLGHTPNSREVIGGTFITTRFRDWRIVVRKAGLPLPGKAPQLVRCTIYKQEYDRQTKLFRSQQQAARERKENAKASRTRDMLQEKEQRTLAETIWRNEHENITNQQLLDYICQCALELGHTPVKKEVLGNELIRERFGSWAAALILAGLELPKGVKPPNYAELQKARRQLGVCPEEQTAEETSEK